MKTAQTIEQQKAIVSTEANSLNTAKVKRKMHPNSLANLVAPWEPGTSGNPGGRPRDVAGEISRAAFENNRKPIYQAVTEKLLAGDAYAFSVHADRGYGKLKQGIIHTGDEDGGPILSCIRVEFVDAE